jgi:hypothetical protein
MVGYKCYVATGREFDIDLTASVLDGDCEVFSRKRALWRSEMIEIKRNTSSNSSAHAFAGIPSPKSPRRQRQRQARGPLIRRPTARLRIIVVLGAHAHVMCL